MNAVSLYSCFALPRASSPAMKIPSQLVLHITSHHSQRHGVFYWNISAMCTCVYGAIWYGMEWHAGLKLHKQHLHVRLQRSLASIVEQRVRSVERNGGFSGFASHRLVSSRCGNVDDDDEGGVPDSNEPILQEHGSERYLSQDCIVLDTCMRAWICSVQISP